MIVENACVLLSGGMDSTAAFMWARTKYPRLFAALFDYGQPNRDHELTAAGKLCEKFNVPRLCIAVADSLPRGRGILNRIEVDDGRSDGLSPAFVPGRNLVFVTSAAAHASVFFPSGNIDVILGNNAQDARRFPDCRSGVIAKLAEALRHGIGREIGIVSPWVDRSKAQILDAMDAEGRAACAVSWSCYRKDGPCETCSACTLRTQAFAAAGLLDECAPAKMVGGDPARG